jgi:quercetin dioxygenase-like cupin family protein
MAEQSKAVRKLIVITGASGWFGALNARALSRLAIRSMRACARPRVTTITGTEMDKYNERSIMKNVYLMLVLLCLMTGTALAQEPEITSLIAKELKDIPGKEVSMITVEYAPGGEDPIHRHNAHAFVYVLEGSIVMELKGGKQVTLKPGETFYEGPDDVHIVGRNASNTRPAKFLVFLVKEKGAPILVPVKGGLQESSTKLK